MFPGASFSTAPIGKQSVSDGNPYSESLFRTLKYLPGLSEQTLREYRTNPPVGVSIRRNEKLAKSREYHRTTLLINTGRGSLNMPNHASPVRETQPR
uniref:Uncharacterized protein n=1 Tax=Candidatus Kentrum sp. FM TaxID=2126340 RepID=A0A450W4R3_9GAMM|nr:MAG: hypothetical protein BECKFM1743A_GA0114220_102374 [Candidatus Kentron sp. FM]VFJ59624.1 MAG: hypothetical protein BECKFM1743C_GA0114222_102504 [Candidatus Kentron sp. FM]VFK12009.1 MAG: hypothetical protein BECKFM1743B_GA0114221_102204 [Candidatus Kentron sp. FM]